jgi:putative Holliday junction resolvase
MDNTWGANFTKFTGKRLLCVDYGTKKAGLAMITPGREPFPIPYGTIAVFDEHLLLATLIKFIEDDSIDTVVLGLPLLLDGKETSMTLKIRSFGEQLAKESGIPVYFQDETLSSFEAEEKLKDLRNQGIKPNMTHVDTIAAMLILEDFLRSDS